MDADRTKFSPDMYMQLLIIHLGCGDLATRANKSIAMHMATCMVHLVTFRIVNIGYMIHT